MPNHAHTPVEVTQADRVIAADILDEVSDLIDHNGIGQVADLIRDGEYDEHDCVKIAARHRLASTRTVDTELLEALKDAREALCNHACHGGDATPCIRSNEQCRAECGKQAGDAIVSIDAAIAKATGHG